MKKFYEIIVFVFMGFSCVWGGEISSNASETDFSELPFELNVQVADFLDGESLTRVASVSKTWRQVAWDVWERRGKPLAIGLKEEKRDFRALQQLPVKSLKVAFKDSVIPEKNIFFASLFVERIPFIVTQPSFFGVVGALSYALLTEKFFPKEKERDLIFSLAPSLKNLDISEAVYDSSYNKGGNVLLRRVCERKWESLEILRCSSFLNEEDIYLFSNACQSGNFSSLTGLDLSGSLRGYSIRESKIAQSLFSSLPSSLTALDLSRNGIGTLEINDLARHTQLCSHLKTLNLSYNSFPSNSLFLLKEKLPCLEEFYLDEIGMKQGAKRLSNVLSSCSCLKFVSLFNSKLCSKDVEHLAFPSSIERIELGGNPIKSEGVSFLINSLGHSSSLKELGLSGCHIDDQGGEMLAEAFEKDSFPGLQKLYFGGNPITQQGKERLVSSFQEKIVF